VREAAAWVREAAGGCEVGGVRADVRREEAGRREPRGVRAVLLA
jgi:hypothetical protein